MERYRVFIRVDGSVQIGLGHLVRCIALAQMIGSHFEVCFICKEIPDQTAIEISDLGFRVVVIIIENDFITMLRERDIVVLDHYGLDSDYQKSIKGLGCKLICIDDVPDRVFFADLIINHAPAITPSDYTAQIYTQFALGLDYVLLRPAFLEAAQESRDVRNIETAFVCFGGSDIKNITQRVVDVLKQDFRFKKIILVCGAAYQNLPGLKDSINRDERFVLFDSIDAESLCALVLSAQLAVVPASGILQEVLATGIKVVSGMYVENQKNIFEKYKELGAFESAENFSRENILEAINRSFQKEEVVNQKFIDGKSGGRLLNAIKQFQTEDQVILRKAEEKDLLKTFEWADNEEIRKYFFNKNSIDLETHKKWFNTKLNSENCFYYLGLFDNKIFGSIRFDVEGNSAGISYLVDPLFQNKGLGTILLKNGLNAFLKGVTAQISSVYGEVFCENTASLKVFQKLGYEIQFSPSSDLVKFNKVIQH